MFVFGIGLTLGLKAQSLTKEEENAYIQDSLETYANYSQYFQKDCGSTPVVSVNAVVRYKDHAEVYIEFDEKSNMERIRLQLKGEGIGDIPLNTEGNVLFIKNLPLEQTYTLTAMNDCDEVIGIANIETTQNNQSFLKVSSKKLFDFVTTWADQKEEEKIGLDQYVLSIRDVNRNEKLAFLQDFYFNDNPFLDDVQDEDVIAKIKEGSGRDNEKCNCKTLELHTGVIANPGKANYPNGPVTNGTPQSYSGKFTGNRSEWAYWANYKGPAKCTVLIGSQRGTGGDGHKSISTEAKTPLISQVLYSLVCVGAQQNPGECECSKRVDIGYRYETRTYTNAEKGTCVCTSKKAYAKAEDWAGIVVDEGNGPKVIELGGVLALSECEMKVNKQFIISAIELASAIALVIVAPPSAPAVISTLTTQIKTIATTEVYDVKSCGSEDKTKVLINGKTSLNLKPGKVVTATLFSFDNLDIGGHHGFKAEARIKSDFFLAAAIPGGSGGTLGSCCSANKADWVSASMEGPLNDDELIDQVNQFTLGYGLKAKSNVGSVADDHVKNCGKVDGIIFIDK